MRVILRVIAILMGAILLLMGGVIVVARAGTTEMPPSEWVAFTSQESVPQTTDCISGIYLVSPKSRHTQQVLSLGCAGFRSLGWSPDGSWLLFMHRADAKDHLSRVRVDGSEYQDLIVPGYFLSMPTWSPDGKWIAFVASWGGAINVWRMRPDGSDILRVAPSSDSQVDPVWSPDGEWIAFVSYDQEQGVPQNIYRVRFDGQNLERLTDESGNIEAPVWSPDGRWIIYSLYESFDRRGLFSVNVQTHESWQLSPMERSFGGWSADDQGLFVVIRQSRQNCSPLFWVRPDGSQKLPFGLESLNTNLCGIVSPDGQSRVIYIDRNDDAGIYLVPSDNSAPQRLTAPGLHPRLQVWSPPINTPFRWWIVIGVGLVLVLAGIAPWSRIAWASRPEAIDRKDREQPWLRRP